MKTFICILTLLISSPLDFATGVSEVTNEIYVVIGAARNTTAITNEPIRFDDKLVFMPFYDRGKVELSYPVDPAYRLRIKMTDSDGKDVPKTSLGQQFGTKFDQLRSVTDTRVYPFNAEGSYKNDPGLGGAKFFSTPRNLFKIEKPGTYTLEIQMQMFYPNPQSTNAYHKDLLQFSPIKIQVEKPSEGNLSPDVKTNSH
jgi:hypothetical protein